MLIALVQALPEAAASMMRVPLLNAIGPAPNGVATSASEIIPPLIVVPPV
jgi:hypothetical protein